MQLEDVLAEMSSGPDAAPTSVDPKAARLVPPSLGAVGVSLEDGRLGVAWAVAPSPEEIARVSGAIGMAVDPVVVGERGFTELVRQAEAAREGDGVHAEQILDVALSVGASDIHLIVGEPPTYRVGGVLRPVGEWPELTAADMAGIGHYLAGSRIDGDWKGDLDCAAAYRGWRFRVSLFRQRQGLSGVLRVIPGKVPPIDSLGLPDAVRGFADLPQGLVLFGGPTGSGKSTSLAALIDTINSTQSRNIITIEDPIEYMHGSRTCLVRQREVGDDTASFSLALRAALRQDPDVILVGEMRDLETIETVLTAAETGHLVFSTVHANDAASAVDRVVDVFPHGQQAQIRTQLAATLAGVVTQALLPAADRPGGRHVVCEVLVANSAVRSHIRSGDSHHIPNDIQTGIIDQGMQPFDFGLAKAVTTGAVARADAERAAHDKANFEAYLVRRPGAPTPGAGRPSPAQASASGWRTS